LFLFAGEAIIIPLAPSLLAVKLAAIEKSNSTIRNFGVYKIMTLNNDRKGK